jgi:hypothetical protein
MPNYDGSLYDPPAPVAQVTLRDPRSGVLAPNVLLLLDGPQQRWSEHEAASTGGSGDR